ncbi:hypothetical protein [Microbacterium oleivorans]|uniref:hypothetical protein n=1 Tax=Microbacterium oleivorans TaxID=273677 RepID=UPI001C4A74E2|nr:hypothetical protein [Microbacterium oleivorans]
MSSRGSDWFTDAYTRSPGATDLVTLLGAEHSLGGMVGYEVAETTDRSPEPVAIVQSLTTAYLRNALSVDDASWSAARAAFRNAAEPIGTIESREARLTRLRTLV